MIRLASPIAALGWLSSLVIHAGVVAWLLHATDRERTRRLPAAVTLSVISSPRVRQPKPVAADLPKAMPVAKPVTASSPPKLTRAPAAKATPVANTPADLSGVTLTGGDGAGWSSMTGNGLAIETPIRSTAASSAPSVAEPSAAAKLPRPMPPPVAIVPAKDLASKPKPPTLNASLVANYPPLAKRQGLAGNARLLVRIDADGVVRQCTVQSASSAEFGAACRQTLLGSRWSTPRDRLGNAVVTQVHYTCDFRVNGS